MSTRQNILVLCAHNSARSQMAEAFLRMHGGDRFAVHSAGLHATEIHPLTRRVMEEVGVPLEGHHAKPVSDFLGKLAVHHLIIVCESTERECPKLLLGSLRRHFWPFPDPAAAEGDQGQQLAAFRSVRDNIQHRVLDWLRESDADARSTSRKATPSDPKEAR